MFKIWIRTFCSENRLIDRNYVLSLLKNEKLKSRLTYGAIASKLNKTEIYVASVFNGEHPLTCEDDFEKLHKLLLSNYKEQKESFKRILSEIPIRGQKLTISSDPTVYRLNEIVNVYGLSLKELIEEKAGNGIMSAIDCKIDVQVLENDKEGKRVQIKMDGKFLQYHC